MPRTNSKVIYVLCLLLIVVLFEIRLSYAGEPDATMQYYLNSVDYIFNKNLIFNTDEEFTYRVRSILEITDYRGRQEDIDTTVFQLFYSDGALDSSRILDSTDMKENTLPDNFNYPQPWKENLMFDFYPNDTGVGELAISFESTFLDSTDATIGFFNLDRDNFYLTALFIYYPNPKQHERVSEVFIFDRLNDYIILKYYERQTVELRFLGRRFTKRTFNYSEYQIR